MSETRSFDSVSSIKCDVFYSLKNKHRPFQAYYWVVHDCLTFLNLTPNFVGALELVNLLHEEPILIKGKFGYAIFCLLFLATLQIFLFRCNIR